MANAKRLPSGNWRVQLFTGYDENGKRIYESFTAPTEAEANLLASTRKVELERGIQKARTPAELTVGEAIDNYINDRDGVLSVKTIREYRAMRRNYAPRLMRQKIKGLTEAYLQQQINIESKRLSPKTIRNLWGLVHSAIRSAVPGIQYNIKLPAKTKAEIHIPTNEQLIQLFELCKGKPIEIPVLLGATCGLRRGEIAALDLSADVDYKKNTITISKAVSNDSDGDWVTKSPKAYSSYRTVDAPAWVIDKLREARDTGYQPMNPGAITSAFRRRAEKLGLEIRFHDLRHYYASLMLSLGVPDMYAMRRMGHATPNMLKNVYQHLMDEKDREVTDSINRYFNAMQHDMQHGISDDDE